MSNNNENLEGAQDIKHIITEEDVKLNPGEGLVVGEEIGIPPESIIPAGLVSLEHPEEGATSEFLDLRPKVPVADIELSEGFIDALHTFKETLPKDHTLNVMADGYPNLEVITFDASIPNTPRHIENLRAILIKNENAYGVHRRYVGTEDELIKQFQTK